MAEKKEKAERKKVLERKYIIPLRKECDKVPYYKRAGKAVKAVKKFIQKHMKVEAVKVGEHLNKHIHKHGRSNVPPRVEVNAVKFEEKDKGLFVIAELVGFPVEKEKPKEEKKKEKPKGEDKKKPEAKKEEAEEELPEEKDRKEEERKILAKGLERERPREGNVLKQTKKQIEKVREEGLIRRSGKSSKGYSR